MNTPNLVEILKQSTEKKGEVKPNLNDFEQVVEENQPNADDFDEPIIEEKLEEDPKLEAPKSDFTGFTQAPKPEKPRLTESGYEKSALMYIAAADGLQTLTLPWLYQKSIFTKEEKIKLKELKQKQKAAGSGGEVSYTEADLKLLYKNEIVGELIDAIPYAEHEIEMLKTPLAAMFSKYNIQPGPEPALITAVIAVSIPRFMPLFNRLER